MTQTSHSKTYLFFPIEIGLAHICRSLAIAEELYKRGHKVIFALPKRKHHIFSRSPVQFVDIEEYNANDDFGMNVKGFRKQEYIEKMIQSELNLIDKYRPDAVIVDFRISAFAAAAIRRVKAYAIFVGDGLPYGAHLPNPGMSKILYRLFSNVFPKLYDLASRWYLRPFLSYMKKQGCTLTFDQWMQPVDFFVPEPSFYMPGISEKLKVHYIGPLGWYGFNIDVPSWFETIRPDGKTIYLSFGGTGFDKHKPIELSKALLDAGYRVIVSTGNISDPSDYPVHPNLYVEKFLPGDIVSSKVDLLICHGGYGTMIDAIHHGVPVLAIPFNPDQILHAARMQELGLAQSLYKLSIGDLPHIFTFDWKYIEEKGKKISSQLVLSKAQEMLRDLPKYRKSLEDFNAKYSAKNGAPQAADCIEGS